MIELTSTDPLDAAVTFRLSFSGDALNAAAAAAAAGARTALLTRVGDDPLGRRLLERIAELGVEPIVRLDPAAPTGAYLSGADPTGQAEFVYLRRGSAASRLSPDDLDPDLLATTSCLLVSGITAALSASATETVLAAASAVAAAGGAVVYDPNFRPRLTTPAAALDVLERVAPHAALVTPSCPGDAEPLLGTADPGEAAERVRAAGARAAAVTMGADGVLLLTGAPEPTIVPPVRPDRVVDQTGAGDALAGTAAARLALGDPVEVAVALGTAAAALSLAGEGGTGRVPTLAETRAALSRVRPAGD
ncbi:sugar kinase [Pseudonocardia sp. S2-4]|uniref:Sugar kinase n=2 Tax=Pseudonocardia humida TaxID=2800819 RepID=A0ABT1ACZ8_9PSEU|nr:sugar kinase [Pseudonocardia humida]